MQYSKEGFIEIEDSDLKNLSIFFGGRGLGKTYSVLKRRVLNAAADPEHDKFIWLRDTEIIIKKIAAGNSLTQPIENIDHNFPHVKIMKKEGNYCFVMDPETDHPIIIGYLMALSTFHNARGISYEDVSTIVWDEFIPEEGSIVKKNQGAVFLNMYESVNRNREFNGSDPVKLIFLSNTNDIYSDVLEDLGVSGLIEDMQYKEEKSYQNEDIVIHFLSSEGFYAKKKDTFIYRINTNDKFRNMALDNNFNNCLALIKRKVNLKGAKGLLTLDNRYTLIQLSDGTLYYKLACWKGLINYDMDNDQEAILYRLLFTDKLRLRYISGQMFFDSIYTQKRILEYSRF